MSTAAAIGYVIGIFIFAIIFRLYRGKMTARHIEKASQKRLKSKEGDRND